MNALEAFEKAVYWVSSISSRIFDKKPGAVIERMSEADRLELRKLKSDDINPDVRLDEYQKFICGDNEYWQNKGFVKERLEFDKKILKK